MNAKISMFVICVEAVIYLLLYNCMTLTLIFSILWPCYIYTAKNAVISPDFLVRKFCRKAQFPKLCGNCAFPQNFHTRKLGEITVFFAMLLFITITLLISPITFF